MEGAISGSSGSESTSQNSVICAAKGRRKLKMCVLRKLEQEQCVGYSCIVEGLSRASVCFVRSCNMVGSMEKDLLPTYSHQRV